MTLDDIFEAADVDGFLHARDLTTGAEVGHRADDLIVPASTFKICVLVELFRQADAGEIDLTEQVTVPVAGRAPGPTGISVMLDPVTLSWRDLALWMIVVSDNAATDVVCERVGLDRVNASMAQLGLTGTVVPFDCRGIFATMYADLGVDTLADAYAISDEQGASLRALDAARGMHSTPRDETLLLELILDGKAASPESCEAIRQILAKQVWPHRLASGFPENAWTTGGKTGTLLTWRNEAGFAVRGDDRFVVSVFTRARKFNKRKDPGADAAIGAAARWAVDELLGRR